MVEVKKFGAAMLAATMLTGMLQTAVLAADPVPNVATYTIAGFENAGKEIGEVYFKLGQAEEELTAQMPQTVTAMLTDGTLEEIPVTWVSLGDYAGTDDFYYSFVPQWDETVYVPAEGIDTTMDVPYIIADRGARAAARGGNSYSVNYDASANVSTIFNFLISEMGYNSGAACGVLANIRAESDFNPKCYGENGTSYGICQWHNERFTALRDWCGSNGYDYTTLKGQLNYLKKEMSANNSDYLYNGKTITNKMLACENSSDGAYDGGYQWCYYYEVPANKGSVAVTRGNVARNTYWPEYGKGTTTSNSVCSIFSDISANAWYKDSVQYVYDNGLMVGASSTKFSPETIMTRAQMAQLLYNAAGQPSVSGSIPFTDVSTGAWYYKAVRWAYKKGYMIGVSSTKFSPNTTLTHEQSAVVLHNFAGKPSSGKALTFSDASQVSSWALAAVKWANGKGMLNYVSLEGEKTYKPKNGQLRAEMAYMLSKS